MGYLIIFLAIALLQNVSAQTTSVPGQNAINEQKQTPYTNVNAMAQNTLLASANGLPVAGQFARNVAYHSNGNMASGNMAPAYSYNYPTQSANLVGNTASYNLQNSNIIPGQHFASRGIAQTNLETNLGFANSNYQNTANVNYANGRPDLANQIRYAKSMPQKMSSGNVASSYNSMNPGYANNNMHVVSGLGAAANYVNVGNVANNLAGADIANNLANSLNGNKLYGNIASMAPAGNMADGFNPYFGISGNPFQVLGGSGSPQIGIHIVADSLEVGGTVTVSGKMPIYGTVSLNGNLPSEGAVRVNYGCTSQPCAKV